MKYSEANIENGKVVEKNTIKVNQNNLTSDCWLVQFQGLDACTNCAYKDTDECGGGETLRKLKER